MNKNYMTYPLKYMRITQNYLGTVSHLKHTTGTPKDFPIDDGGKDQGRDAVYCPCDEMKITAIKGYGNSKITNTIWLVSTTPVVTPTFTDIAFMTLTHENDSDLKKLKVGDTFQRGDIICYEGTDGATSNHIHLTSGRGFSNNWQKSTSNAWVITGDTKKPEEVFFIDPSFTTVLSKGGVAFQNLPSNVLGSPVERNVEASQIEVKVDNLRAREEAGLEKKVLGYVQKGIYTYTDKVNVDQYDWYKIENFWIAYSPNWETLYPKVEKEEVVDDSPSVSTPSSPLETPKFIFQAPASKYYKIYLKENAKLYLKDS